MKKISNYDLEDRTAHFGEKVIKFCIRVNENAITRVLISQVIRSSTSIGANYMEANSASSKKDFKNKISICRKESTETRHWLKMLAQALPERKKDIKILYQESYELSLIFSKIISTLNN